VYGVQDSQLSRGRAIHRRTGRTFYYATRLLPERVRHPTYVLYGFFRIADEVVDGDEFATAAAQRAELKALRAAALGREPADDPVVAAFAEVRARHGFSDADVEAFVDAMAADVDTDRYDTYDDLEAYMRGSAAAVGHMMCALMDPDDPDRAAPHAAALGEAFQLTNFVRDVREDAQDLERIYLPLETLDRFGVDQETVLACRDTPALRRAVRAELRRAETLYREGVAGIQYLPRDCQLPVLVAAVLYAEHHRLVREREFDVVTARPSLSRARKLWTVGKALWAWHRLGDPVAVFDRVSAVPSTPESAAGHDDAAPARPAGH
jgi:phytoene synthase